MVRKGETQPRVYAIQRDPMADWLKDVVDAADPDPWRQRVREASELASHRRASRAREVWQEVRLRWEER